MEGYRGVEGIINNVRNLPPSQRKILFIWVCVVMAMVGHVIPGFGVTLLFGKKWVDWLVDFPSFWNVVNSIDVQTILAERKEFEEKENAVICILLV